jgi:hypothetical protein
VTLNLASRSSEPSAPRCRVLTLSVFSPTSLLSKRREDVAPFSVPPATFLATKPAGRYASIKESLGRFDTGMLQLAVKYEGALSCTGWRSGFRSPADRVSQIGRKLNEPIPIHSNLAGR